MLALPFRRVLLDGELVAHGPDGKPDFTALMRTAAHFQMGSGGQGCCTGDLTAVYETPP